MGKEILDPELSKCWSQVICGYTKIFVSIYVRVLSRDLMVVDRDIQVYSLCPGFYQTDMTEGIGAQRTSQQSAVSYLYLADTLPFKIDSKLQDRIFKDVSWREKALLL